MPQLKSKLLKVGETRVWRTYVGGQRIDKWRGHSAQRNGHFPEDWIASTVLAVNPGRERSSEGLSRVLNLPGQPVLKTLLEDDPAAWLGALHASQLGSTLGMLIKIIDAGERLTIQVHPDRTYAKQVFHSDYGKTEAWYILGGSPDACIYMGFKPGVTREHWKRLFDTQDIPAMLASLHRIHVKAGDSFLVQGGVPHAIGEGCFLIEVQEPTDYTMRTELVTPGGLHIHMDQCHQGVGFEKMLDCFHYEGLTQNEVEARWKVEPITRRDEGAVITRLIDERYTHLFGMRCIAVDGIWSTLRPAQITVFTVIEGEGHAATTVEATPVCQGDFLLVPAGVERLTLSGHGLKLVECIPPTLA
ncbi:MAG: type I phosphomannose isomerase catalytic subunit [Lawsonibacter sp.]|nr:type I phosphomannose isomerase catalytic subunit [Lawsonibacter sp.]